MLTFYKIDAKHAHHPSPPQYINTSQYIQQRANTIYRIGCQRLRIANTNIYHDIFVLVPALKMEGEGMLLLLAVSSSSPPGGIDCSRVLGHKWNPMLGHKCNPIFTPFLAWRFDDERAIVARTKMALSLSYDTTSALPHQLAVT